MTLILPYNDLECGQCRALGEANKTLIGKVGRNSFNDYIVKSSETYSTFNFIYIDKDKITKDSLDILLKNADDSLKYVILKKHVFHGGGPHEIKISKKTCKLVSFEFRD